MKYGARISLLTFALVASTALAHNRKEKTNPVDLHDYLVAFHANPVKVMNTPLAERDADGNIVKNNPLRAISEKEADRAFKAHVELGEKLCAAAGEGCPRHRLENFAAIDQANQVENFLYETDYLKTLAAMEKADLKEAVMKTPPWSDSYWPLKLGLIGRRWMDRGFPNSSRWLDNYNYILAVPATAIPVDIMSPAEKYDLLVGDSNWGLTQAVWAEGKSVANKDGFTPSWAGLCHGWSPASIMTPAPKHSVSLPASGTGPMITFYPSDIKALAAMAWGASPPKLNIAGIGAKRCAVRHPQEDEVGRVINPNCLGVNPATFHIGTINQLGVDKRSYIVDANYDLEVWNFPVYAYQYEYFNPQTLQVSTDLRSAMVKFSDFTIDKFRKYRSPDAQYAVGIAMDLTYVIPTQPSTQAILNPPIKRITHTIKYVYDLELNAKGEIIGGEWYSNFHPGFIWNLPPGSHTLSVGESKLNSPVAWDGKGPLAPELEKALQSSSSAEQPLAAVVDELEALGQTDAPPAP